MDLETTQTNAVAKLPLLKQARTTTNADGTSTLTIPGPVTTEEKTQKKNDAKTLFASIQTRFGGNDATKKT
ncbi:hypothetical protein Tco_0311568 [Tanacetum coccineum]